MQPDTLAIIGTVNLYAFATDTRQWQLFDRVFTPDVQADFGGPQPWHDLASLKRDFETIHAPFSSTQHITTNHVVTIAGDAANCLSYVHGRFTRPMEGGTLFESTGWYDDQLIRTESGWRIRNRMCRMVWWGGNPAVLLGSPDIPAAFPLYALASEAQAGGLAFLTAIMKN